MKNPFKFFVSIFIPLLLVALVAIIFYSVGRLGTPVHSEKNHYAVDKIVSEKLITIEIDGQKYLFGRINGTTVLAPKQKCKCN